MTNAEYAKEVWFVKDCADCGVTPSKRQASKFRMKMGKVYKMIFDSERTSRRP